MWIIIRCFPFIYLLLFCKARPCNPIINNMPAKNSIKQYLENSYYHLYNRGVEKRTIFLDQQDYSVFLLYLKEYLLPKDKQGLREKLSDENISSKERDKILKLLRLNNFTNEITLAGYCLMDNHFHFLIKQTGSLSIYKFMNSLGTRYTMYFNRKYKRVGSLYQGVYKAVLVKTEGQLLHLTHYIHQQALASQGETLRAQPCSYLEYIGKRKTPWVRPEEVLKYYYKIDPYTSYEKFMQKNTSIGLISKLIIEKDF